MNNSTVTPNPSLQKTRDYYIDNIKTIYIFLVVLGHLLDYLVKAQIPFATNIRTWIYFFHMPGFVFISGYLAKSFIHKPYKGDKLLQFAWLYLLFKNAIELGHYIFRQPYFANGNHKDIVILIILLLCIAIWLLSWGCQRYTIFRRLFMLLVIGISLFNTNILLISGAPWYLLSLIMWHSFIYLTRHMNPKYVLAGTILAAAILGYQAEIGMFLSLSRTIHFLPFFLMGYYMSTNQFIDITNHKKVKLVAPGILILYTIIILFFGKPTRYAFGIFMYGVSPYEKLPDVLYGFAPFLYFIWMILAAVLMFSLFVICPRNKTIFSYIGKNTISVYVLHRLFKDFLFYAGMYDKLSTNEYIAVAQLALISMLLVLIFGKSIFAKMISNLTILESHILYTKK